MFRLFKRKNNLNNHPIFTSLDYWSNSYGYNLPIDSIPKKNVCIAFLKIIFSTYSSNLKQKLVKKPQMSNNKEYVKNLIYEIISEYENIAKSKGVPISFIEKFKNHNISKTDKIISCIEDICNSKFYSSDHEKCAAILHMIHGIFQCCYIDIGSTINELNGSLELELKGTIYDNSINF